MSFETICQEIERCLEYIAYRINLILPRFESLGLTDEQRCINILNEIKDYVRKFQQENYPRDNSLLRNVFELLPELYELVEVPFRHYEIEPQVQERTRFRFGLSNSDPVPALATKLILKINLIEEKIN